MTRSILPLCFLALAGCSSGGGGYFYVDLATSQPDLVMGGEADMANNNNPPDLANNNPPPDLAMAANKPVGASCAASNECSGPNPKCQMGTLPSTKVAVPAGYCSNQPCGNDADCGAGGFCTTIGNFAYCVAKCSAKNQCDQINQDNRCFTWDVKNGQYRYSCLPQAFSQCDPTDNFSCGNKTQGMCQRVGIDNVGFCYDTCTFNGNCAADLQGNPRACYFINDTVDVNQMPTSDVAAGLVCLSRGNLGLNQACTYLNDCAPGYECDIYKVGGSKLCRKLCQGDCSAVANTTCKNALLDPKVGTGLCLP